jgi:hypothetical protein
MITIISESNILEEVQESLAHQAITEEMIQLPLMPHTLKRAIKLLQKKKNQKMNLKNVVVRQKKNGNNG